MQDSAAKHPEDGKLNKFTAPGRWPTPYPTEIHIPRSFPDSDWNTHGRWESGEPGGGGGRQVGRVDAGHSREAGLVNGA